MAPDVLDEPAPVVAQAPLCVDLDGTLVKSDTLLDSLLVLLRSRPLKVLSLPQQVLKGKAAFKAFVTDTVSLDVIHLPYNRPLLRHLQQEHSRGRVIYLATGADIRLAERVAHHLGIFTAVLGSDGSTNLTGQNKLDRLRSSLGSDSFDYIGNATADLPLLALSAKPMVANPSLALLLTMRARGLRPVSCFRDQAHPLHATLRTLRMHQWAKNLLIFLPLLLSHQLALPGILTAAMAVFCFSLAASGTYILNDLLDIEADRRHPSKQLRPFASGDVSPAHGLGLSAVLLLLALTGARWLPVEFFGWLGLYLVTTIAYTSLLKRFPIVDVLVLSGLYTLRLLAGAAATATPISHWLAGFSIFLFLSLAFVKRFAELENLNTREVQPHNGRGYRLDDLAQLRSFGTASAYAAVVIFAIYISGQDVTALYRHPSRLWFVVPFMILWLNRVWLLASRGELNEDPVIFALKDRMSLLIGAVVGLIVYVAV